MATISGSHSVQVRGNIIILSYDSEQVFIPSSGLIVLTEEGSTFITIRTSTALFKLNYLTNTNLSPTSTTDYATQVISLIKLQEVETRSAFGEAMISQNKPVIQVKNIYNVVNTRQVETFITNDATVTNSDSLFLIKGGSGIEDFSVLRSKKYVNYRPGQGIVSRFTAIYDTATSGYWQIAGVGNTGNGLYFGYDGVNFGILRQTGGKPECRTFEITTAATITTNAVVVLNDVVFNVPVTPASGDLTFTAWELAQHNYTGWNVEAVGSSVIFISTSTGPLDGLYQYSPIGAGAATITRTTTGVATTSIWTHQDDWNNDKMNGTGPSGVILNPQNGNVFQISFQWLGFGQLSFFIEDPVTGLLQNVHNIRYANSFSTPSVEKPIFKNTFAVYSIGGSGSELTLKTASFASFLQGESVVDQDNILALSNSKTLDTNTDTVLAVIKNRRIFNGTYNLSTFILRNITFATDDLTSFAINIYKNPTLDVDNPDFVDFSYVDENNSTALFNTNADTGYSSPGELIYSTLVSRRTTLSVNELRNITLQANDILMIIGRTATGNNQISYAINWLEEL